LHAQAQVKHRQEVNKPVAEEVRKGGVKDTTELKKDSSIKMMQWTKLVMNKYPDFYHYYLM